MPIHVKAVSKADFTQWVEKAKKEFALVEPGAETGGEPENNETIRVAGTAEPARPGINGKID